MDRISHTVAVIYLAFVTVACGWGSILGIARFMSVGTLSDLLGIILVTPGILALSVAWAMWRLFPHGLVCVETSSIFSL